MSKSDGVGAARMLFEEHRDGVRQHPFAEAFGIAEIGAAYATQDEFVRLQVESRRVSAVGYKIGLTSPRMQAMCGIDSPVAGVVLSDRVHASGVRLAASNYGRLGLEFEIAVRMARDLVRDERPITLAEAAEAVDAVCPAMEIVDDRHCVYPPPEVFSLIADNSWNAGIVLGEFRRPWPDLAELEGVVSVNGVATDRGFGREVLGHPFHSVAWLAEHLARRGGGLRAGDIIMTGNLVTTKFPAESSRYRFDLASLGSVELSIDVRA